MPTQTTPPPHAVTPQNQCASQSPEKLAPGDLKKRIDKIVRTLNAHHMKTSAGFYAQEIGGLGRFFRARRTRLTLEVFDFEQWFVAPIETNFWDHNGRGIDLGKARIASSQ